MSESANGNPLATFDLGGWSSERRDALQRSLDAAAIAHEWEAGGVLVVGGRDAARIEALLEEADPTEPAADRPSRALGSEHSPQLASGWRRLGGYLADGVVLICISLGVRILTGVSFTTRSVPLEILGVALSATYEIGGVAIWGRTLGKLLVGTRVVSLESEDIPDWSGAGRRWILPATVGIVAIAAPPVGLFASVASIAIYAPVLWDPLRQGLHDRMAGTVVVYEPPRARPLA